MTKWHGTFPLVGGDLDIRQLGNEDLIELAAVGLGGDRPPTATHCDIVQKSGYHTPQGSKLLFSTSLRLGLSQHLVRIFTVTTYIDMLTPSICYVLSL